MLAKSKSLLTVSRRSVRLYSHAHVYIYLSARSRREERSRILFFFFFSRSRDIGFAHASLCLSLRSHRESEKERDSLSSRVRTMCVQFYTPSVHIGMCVCIYATAARTSRGSTVDTSIGCTESEWCEVGNSVGVRSICFSGGLIYMYMWCAGILSD